MDDFHTRTTGNLRARHETQITENAERMRDHIGYVLGRIESGRPETVGLYAADIAASAQRILLAVAALETLEETMKILETSGEPAKET